MLKVVPTRLGDAYQAEIPPLATPQQQQDAQRRDPQSLQLRDRQVWASTAFSEDQVAEFLSCTRLNDTEAALRCLHEGDYDVARATQLLHLERQRRLRTQRQRLHTISDEAFEAAVEAHGKRFFVIAQQHPGAETSELVARFYKWKTTTSYKRWHERVKARKNKEAARLRQWADSEGESDAADFHNEHCDLCFTGGQLLCCDGCERAFHFSCVDPPIKDVPMGDWFCNNCATVLGTQTTEQPSAENPFCMEVVVNESASDDEEIQDDGDEEENDVTDEMESENGNARDDSVEEIDDEPMDDFTTPVKKPKVTLDVVVVKQEAPAQPSPYNGHQRLYTPERMQQHRPLAKRLADADTNNNRTPSRSPLTLEQLSNSTSRKRQRKVVAPRRIPQEPVPTFASK